MPTTKATFFLQILSLRGVVFEEEVESVYLFGTEGEFELLPFHSTLLAAIPEGAIHIANFPSIPVKIGVVMFRENKCTILAETPTDVAMKQLWDKG